MTTITAAMVRELRDSTGAGMMDCKKALAEVGGDMEAAVDWLRKNGLAAAAKKAGRVAAEGLIGVEAVGMCGTMVEVNAETDFVARNEAFRNFVEKVTHLAFEQCKKTDDISTLSYNEDRTVGEELTHLISIIGENMSIRRVAGLSVQQGVVTSYIHNMVTPHLGRIGVLVGIESAAKEEALQEIGKQIAMHVAAARPIALRSEDISADILQRERDVLTEQAKASGRPEAVIAKMIEGRMRKFYEENALLEQKFVINPDITIREFLVEKGKELGCEVALTAFERFELGEGIAKKEDNFAEEVASMAT